MDRRLALLAIVGLSMFAGIVWAADLTHTKDSLSDVKARVAKKDAILIDVRSEDEWKDGHLRVAQLLPLTDLMKMSESEIRDRLPNGKIIYTHCGVGARALKAGKIIEKYGYDIRPLKQGYEELVKAGFEAAK